MKTKILLILLFTFIFLSCGDSNKKTTNTWSQTLWVVYNIDLLEDGYARFYIKTINVNNNYTYTTYITDTIGAFQPGDTVIFKLKR